MITRPLLFIALIVWYVFAVYWYVCQIKNHHCNCRITNQLTSTQTTDSLASPSTTATPRFILTDGANTVVDIPDNATFTPSNATPQLSPAMQQALSKTAGLLKTAPDKTLQLTGYYGKTEKNNTMFDNLGLARADAIKQQLIAMGAPDAQITTASQQNDNLPTLANGLFTNALTATLQNRQTQQTQQAPRLVVKDGSETVLDIADNVQFPLSAAKPALSPNVQNGLKQLAQYLKNHPDRRLNISGNYLNTEKNNTTFANLGLARAHELKQQLELLGANPNQIETGGKLAPNLSLANNTITGALDWVFMVTAARQQDLTAKARNLYFDSGKALLEVNDDLRTYFRDVKTYLDQNPQSKVLLTGHTDNTGNTATNQTLGLKRANEVKLQLARLGIDKNKITTTSKGETQPVQTNDTPEGKKANRRVEMLVQ